MVLGIEAAPSTVVLRVTILYLRDRTKVVLSGQLVGQWAECLPKAIPNAQSPQADVEFDLDGITCVDRAGEEALLALLQAHGHFVCKSPFAQNLCVRLGIPVEGSAR
jgi:ABC-type transporter Mla MlaB component